MRADSYRYAVQPQSPEEMDGPAKPRKKKVKSRKDRKEELDDLKQELEMVSVV